MQTARTTLPKLKAFRRHAKATPERGARYLLPGKSLSYLGDTILELFTRLQYAALLRRPSTYLTLHRTLGKIFLGFLARCFCRSAAYNDLTFEIWPKEMERNVWINVEIAGLFTVVICKENKSLGIDAL